MPLRLYIIIITKTKRFFLTSTECYICRNKLKKVLCVNAQVRYNNRAQIFRFSAEIIFPEKKMLTAEGKRKRVTSFTIHESLYNIIRTLQRTIYIEIKAMYAAHFATIGES